MRISTVLLVMALAGPASATASRTVAVMPLRSINVPQYVTEVLDSTLAVAVGDVGAGLRVLSANDINTMLGVERMKDAIGCDEVSCAVDIGGALNAELIVTGSIGKLGNKLTINLVLVNIAETVVEARVQETIRDDENVYQDGVRGATQRLFQNGLSRPSEPEPGATSSIATAKQEAAATREAVRQQLQTLGRLVETVEMEELSKGQRLALVEEFAATLNENAPAKQATTTLRAALESGGPPTTRNVMLGVYGFGGWGKFDGTDIGAVGVMLEAGRFRWRHLQVSSVRASVGTTTRPAYEDNGYGNRAPLLAGIGVGGVGAKMSLDAIGQHEIGFLAFPLSVNWLWASSRVTSAFGNDFELSQSLYGFLRSAAYYRFSSTSWSFEAGLELTPIWQEADTSFYSPVGDRAAGEKPPIVAYAGATWPRRGSD
jgi:hypothetical protein